MVDFLIKCLDHKNFDGRGAAALALGRAGNVAGEPAIAPLEKMTGDSHHIAAESAVLALGMLQNKTSVPLLKTIRENPKANHRLRAHAAVALGLVSSSCSARTMMDLLRRPKLHEQVKASCMMGLALMKEESAALALTFIMNNRGEKKDLRAMAATALGKMGITEFRKGSGKIDVVEMMVQILASPKKNRKLKLSAIMAVSALGPSEKIGSDELVDVLGRLYTTEKNSDVRSFILMGIAELARDGRAREKARMLFRNVLRGESNQSILAYACLAAGISGDRDAVRFLEDIFRKKSNPELRSAAAVGLGLLKDVAFTKTLVDTISGKGSPELKGYCCMSLGLMGVKDNKEALPALRAVLAEGNIPELRAAAAMALTLLGEARAVNNLLEAVQEGNGYIRMSIIMAVGYFRDMRSVRPLMDLFNSDDGMNDEIRAITLTAIGYIIEEAEKPILKRLATHYNYLLDRYDALLQIVKLL